MHIVTQKKTCLNYSNQCDQIDPLLWIRNLAMDTFNPLHNSSPAPLLLRQENIKIVWYFLKMGKLNFGSITVSSI